MQARKALTAVCAAAFSLIYSAPSHANLITNGSFEEPFLTTQSISQYAGGDSFSGWSISGINSVVISNNIGTAYTSAAYWPRAQDGTQYLYLNTWGNNNTAATQSIGLDGGTTYHLSFYLNGLINGLGSSFDYSPSVMVGITGPSQAPLTTTTAFGTNNRTWTKIDFDFFVAAQGNYDLRFATPGIPLLPAGQPYNFITLDHVELTALAAPVPEPETYTMVLAGLGLIGSFARRRKQP
jgi:hypothetical protein